MPDHYSIILRLFMGACHALSCLAQHPPSGEKNAEATSARHMAKCIFQAAFICAGDASAMELNHRDYKCKRLY